LKISSYISDCGSGICRVFWGWWWCRVPAHIPDHKWRWPAAQHWYRWFTVV